VLDDLQSLMMESKLFSDPQRARHAAGTLNKKRKKNNTQAGFKVGQGGTLDPLADGVLGRSDSGGS
jgi:tRNA pseudouridine55 synthase